MNLPSWLKASLITSAQTFVAAALLAVLSLMNDIQEWTQDGPVPDYKAATRLVLAAAIAALSGLVTAVYRKLVPPEVTYPDPPPAP